MLVGRRFTVAIGLALLGAAAAAAPAQERRADLAPPSGRISGRVVAADTGRPVQRARVSLGGGRQGRVAITDESGAFDLTGLAPGRYTLSVSKTGYVPLSYGQRRPLLPGAPLQLGADQQLSGIEFRLPRGSVISGHVFDEIGDPLPGTMVQVLRRQLVQGERRLMPAGTAQTDDRGQYRVWGLNPGEYFVSAMPRPELNVVPGRGRGARGGTGPFAVAMRGLGVDAEEEPTSYAPTYFPGVASPADAQPVTVGLSAEVLNIDFGVLRVRTARVAGRAMNPDGSVPEGGSVNLVLDDGRGRGGGGRAFGARIRDDGTFSIGNVPPGRYILRARSQTERRSATVSADGRLEGRSSPDLETKVTNPRSLPTPYFAAQPITVDGADVENLMVMLSAGATVTGTIALDGSGTATPPSLSQFRVMLAPVDFEAGGPNRPSDTDRQGRFTIRNVPAGTHRVRVNAPGGWTLKSLRLAGSDVTDADLEVRSGESLPGLTAVFTNRLTELSGTVANTQGQTVSDYTVLAFPGNRELWRPQSRHIMTARPDQNGRYQLRGLPPGAYHVAMIDPVEQGEWFDPEFLEQQITGASRVTLSEGGTQVHDLRVR